MPSEKETRTKIEQVKKQLYEEYASIDTLFEAIPDDWQMNISRKKHAVFVAPINIPFNIHEGDFVIVYFQDSDGVLRRVNLNKLKAELINHLKFKISIEKFLDDVLTDMSTNDLLEIYERAVEKKGKIKEKEGCYQLLIGGKKGAPVPLMLRY